MDAGLRNWMAVLGMLLAQVAGAAPQTRELDIRAATPATLAAMTASAGLAWWIGLGDSVLVTGEPAALDAIEQTHKLPRLREWPALDPQELLLEARGCGVHASSLPALADVGRYALLRMPVPVARRALKTRGDVEPLTLNRHHVLRWDKDPRSLVKGTPDPNVQRVVAALDVPRWFTTLSALAGFDRNTFGSGRAAARDWLVLQFQGIAGINSVSTPSFPLQWGSLPYTSENVLAVMPGLSLPDEWIVVGAHYDSRNPNGGPSGAANSPGAEDNASGCAGVLEMARLFSRFRAQRTMIFICFSGEEQGLWGSYGHVSQLVSAGDLSKVRLMLNMDMIGYSGDADLDVLLETDSAQQALLAEFASQAQIYAPSLRIVNSTNPCCSDHVPYLQNQLPALLTIANDWNSYVHYHQSSDIPANVSNAQAMGGAILRMNAAVLALRAGAGDAVFLGGFE